MIRTFNCSCQGESHKATDKVCQDYSLSYSENGLAVAIVCDGHGGERYFRSDIGAQYAAEITLDAIRLFAQQMGSTLFAGKQFTAIGATNTLTDAEVLSAVDSAFRHLFSSIIYQWNEKINQHAKTAELSEWEKEHVPPKYLEEFCKAETFEKQYGCTLMGYAQTSEYWFAFHIGDGKCLSFQESPVWREPIPWDERCFLNKTTSLCDTSAIEEFRYCYQGDGHFPTAVILGSDGLDDSFGETSNLANFYIQILKMLEREGMDATLESLRETLPQLSKIGSKDDMSVACVFDDEKLTSQIAHLIQYQIGLTEANIEAVDARIKAAKEKIEAYANSDAVDEKGQIEINYAKQKIVTANEERSKLQNTLDSQRSQLAEITASSPNCNVNQSITNPEESPIGTTPDA